MSMAYIRKAYGLDLKAGERVQIRRGAGTGMDGQEGKLLRARGSYLVVKAKHWKGAFHPSDVQRATQAAKQGEKL